MIRLCVVLLVILGGVAARAAPLSLRDARTFADDLMHGRIVPDAVILPSEYAIAHRLGIRYDDVPGKFLVTDDFPADLRHQVIDWKLRITVRVDTLTSDFTRVTIRVVEKGVEHRFYFKGKYLVSPAAYHARAWATRDGIFFRFLVSDTSKFNRYAAAALDSFVVQSARILGITADRMALLGREKILYLLCRDEDEVERVTGVRTLGMYDVATDRVVSMYQMHAHEVFHLLVNFRLKQLPLFTHPFFQEGAAVACGGRGGRSPAVMFQVGDFLQQSGFLTYDSLLAVRAFRSVDPSMSYPLAGLYNKFLLEQYGTDRYLTLYRKYSGDGESVGTMVIDRGDLPPDEAWREFLRCSEGRRTLFACPEGRGVSPVGTERFTVADTTLYAAGTTYAGYLSPLFGQVFPGREYKGEKYLILANEAEIRVYNLYTDMLIAQLAASLSWPPAAITREGGTIGFCVPSGVFDAGERRTLVSFR